MQTSADRVTTEVRPDQAASAAGRNAMVSTLALVAANSLPLLGAIYLKWPVFAIILIYWLENVVVGVFNVLRIAIADPDQPVLWVAKLFLIPFFCFHFGMFTYVHGVFVFTLFGDAAGLKGHAPWPTPALVRAAIQHYGIGFAVFALFMSHAASFVWNYVLRGEFRRVGLKQLMVQPYLRVMVLHIAIIAGGMLTVALGSPLGAVVALVAVKTVIDVGMHRRERERLATRGAESWFPAATDPAET